MFHRGGGQKRSPRYTVITHVATLFAMALSVVKGALRHVCTLRPVFLSRAPQAPCHSRGRPALSVPTSIPANSTPPLTYHPPPQGSTCPRPLTLECPQSKRTLPSKEKQKWTEKRQNGPTLLLLSRFLTGPEKGAPRGGFIWRWWQRR